MKTPTMAAATKATKDAPATAARTAGMMMKTLLAGVTDDSVMRTLPRSDSDLDSCCSYRPGPCSAMRGSLRRRYSSNDSTNNGILSRTPDHGSVSAAPYAGGRKGGDQPMPRPRNQTARRDPLPEPALQVINERGPADLQMKDVAGAAGLATGSVYYYYDNVDELLRHVHAMAYERYYTARLTAVEALADAREQVRTMVQLGLPKPADQPLSLALYQVAVAKARDPHHAEMITDLCGQQVRLYERLL